MLLVLKKNSGKWFTTKFRRKTQEKLEELVPPTIKVLTVWHHVMPASVLEVVMGRFLFICYERYRDQSQFEEIFK